MLGCICLLWGRTACHSPIVRRRQISLLIQDEGIADVNEMIQSEKPSSDLRLREVLDELSAACSRYVAVSRQVKGRGAAVPIAGRTRLDVERLKMCQRETASIQSGNLLLMTSDVD